MLVLGIESSCDETAAAVVADGRDVLSSIIASQIPFHKKYGGVVPEIASRKHVENILPVVNEAMDEVGVGWQDLAAVAVTVRPGLIGSLVVGVVVAKTIAYVAGLPLVGINHMAAHMYANCLIGMDYQTPHLALLVSGGHTLLIDNQGGGNYQILGRTVDDAAGEAFDKVAKLLRVGYPGGPAIEALAKDGDPSSVRLPLPMKHSGDENFSFSGLKTAVRTAILNNPQLRAADVAASFQKAVVDILSVKTSQALDKLKYPVLALSGGVAANQALRLSLQAIAMERGIAFWAPPLNYCTDNAAMVAGLGFQMLQRGHTDSLALNVVAI